MNVTLQFCTKDQQTHEMTVSLPVGNITLEQLIEPFRVIFSKVISLSIKGKKVSCKKGCSVCCNQLVPLSIPEVFHLHHVLETLPPGHKRRVKKRFTRIKNKLHDAKLLADIKDPVKVMTLDQQYFELGFPCPFLESESCSIYASRPFICREYFVESHPELCRRPYISQIQKVDVGINIGALLTVFSARLLHLSKTPVPLIIAPQWAEEFHAYRIKTYDSVLMFQQLFNALTEFKPGSGNIQKISVIGEFLTK
ncbi:MAG: YkgJ family cysteine cluster protein [Spirochaetales bacterium]|nr:YkgJ family cysteine cluster protein [Spirochaetales bacterium]